MKVIKIKVKTIIVTVLILFCTIPYIFYFIGVLGFQSDGIVNGRGIKIYT